MAAVPDLEGRLELDTSEGLQGIDTIDSRLSQVITDFKVGLADALNLLSGVSVNDVDASQVTTSIDQAVTAADTSPEIEADASDVTTSIDSAVDAVDATVTPEVAADGITQEIDSAVDAADAVVTVEADVSDAESEIAGLGDAAGEASGGLDSLGESGGRVEGVLSAIGPTAGFAAGNLSDLGGAAGGLVPEAAAATGAVAGLAAAGGVLFTKALDQQTALERLNRTFGETADDVQQVDVGGLNEDISSLALRTGGADEGLQNFAATMGQAGISAGKSKTEIAATADQVIALATRASLLNPTLGTSDEIVGRLSNGLARGGKFLRDYGISLNAAEINARALRDTGKSSADQLNVYEKSAAGAALATEQLGTQLAGDINAAAETDANKMRALGTAMDEALEGAGDQLIRPIVDNLTELEPAVETAAGLLGDTLGTVLTDVTPLVEGLGSAIEGVNSVLEDLGAGSLGEILGSAVAGPLGVLGGMFGKTDAAAHKLGVTLDNTSRSFSQTGKSVDETATSMADALTTSEDLGPSVRRLGLTTDDLLRAAEGGKVGVGGLRQELQATGRASGDYADDADKVTKATQQLADSLQRNARQALDNLVNTGKLDASQVAALESTTKLASGNSDFLSILRILNPAQADQVENTTGTADAMDNAATAADSFKASLDKLLTPILNSVDADVKWHQSIDDITKSLAENGNTIDLNTEKGRKNVSAIDDLVKGGTDLINNLIAEGNSVATVTARRDEVIARLREEEKRYPALAPLIDRYIGQILAIPLDRPTQTDLPNAGVAGAKADALHGQIAGIPRVWNTDVNVAVHGGDAIKSLYSGLQAVTAFDNRTVDLTVETHGTAGLQQILGASQGRMAGGPTTPGTWLVGEAGPEIVVTTSPGFVVSHADAVRVVQQAVANQGGGVSSLDEGRLLAGLARIVASQRPIQVYEAVDPIATAVAVDARQGLEATR